MAKSPIRRSPYLRNSCTYTYKLYDAEWVCAKGINETAVQAQHFSHSYFGSIIGFNNLYLTQHCNIVYRLSLRQHLNDFKNKIGSLEGWKEAEEALVQRKILESCPDFGIVSWSASCPDL